ncbi:MAG: prepilin peptidase, partial [Lentisphaeraceae bacterium]|nr:prepilin peptidase [Lentisphaeraceae bacterium]
DFLRDQIRMGTKQTSGRVLLNNIHKETKVVEPTLRGLEFAIVDEIDSVMIDDGVTPLLISSEGSQKEDVAMYCKARDTAATLTKKHYKDPAGVSILLTPLGKSHLAKVFATTGGPWAYKRRRDELIIQGRKALHIFHKDKQYIIDEEKIVIVDQATGRTMPDRTWRNGMHQAIEAKENLEISPPKDTCARISFRKFFKLYRSLCGMTGTASEAGSEFYDYYLMPVVKIPTNRPCLRKFIGHTITNTENKKWEKVAEEIQQWHKKKRPILVGTASIKDSELLSEQLNKLAIAHQVLNAKNHLEESDIIKQAGIAGKITVATSMAGRGTDIKLSAESKKAGGLLVITTQLYHSKRVDRQLFGRCSRQGDPGSVKCFYSLEDDILKQHLGVLRHLLLPLSFLPDALLLTFFKMAQKISSSKSRKQRKSVLKSDDWLDDMLGFTGEGY